MDDWLPELNSQDYWLNCPQFFTKLNFVITPAGSLSCVSTDDQEV